MQIGLHDDREKCLVDATAAFQQRWEERPPSQLRDPQFQIPSRRRQRPRPGPVALRRAIRRAFVLVGANQRGRFGIDQLLIQRFGRDPNPVSDIGEFQLGQQIKQGRLVKSHRVLCPLVRFLDSSHCPSHDGSPRRRNDAQNPRSTPLSGTRPIPVGRTRYKRPLGPSTCPAVVREQSRIA